MNRADVENMIDVLRWRRSGFVWRFNVFELNTNIDLTVYDTRQDALDAGVDRVLNCHPELIGTAELI